MLTIFITQKSDYTTFQGIPHQLLSCITNVLQQQQAFDYAILLNKF
jgi:hypothetical protein